MVSEPLYIGAYWGSRPESAEECASRMSSCLRSFAGRSPVLARWKPKGRSRSEALAAMEVPQSRLVEVFEGGVNRRDSDGSAIPELGYSWSAWNGDTKVPVSVSVTCGAWTAAVGVSNFFVLDLPGPADGPADLYEREGVESLLAGVVQAWAPDWAVVTSHGLREACEREPAQPVVGWLTYLAPGRSVPDGLTGVEVSRMDSGSVVVIAQAWPEVQTADVRRVAAQLDSVGALRPIT